MYSWERAFIPKIGRYRPPWPSKRLLIWSNEQSLWWSRRKDDSTERNTEFFPEILCSIPDSKHVHYRPLSNRWPILAMKNWNPERYFCVGHGTKGIYDFVEKPWTRSEIGDPEDLRFRFPCTPIFYPPIYLSAPSFSRCFRMIQGFCPPDPDLKSGLLQKPVGNPIIKIMGFSPWMWSF